MACLRTTCVIAALLLLGLPSASAQTVVHVDSSASPENCDSATSVSDLDGSSWGCAYPFLQDALDEVNINASTEYEIRVAEGTYYPDEDTVDNDGDSLIEHSEDDKTESFTLRRDSVTVLGGYPPGGGSRDPATYETVLSGDLSQDDDPFAPNIDSDNDSTTPSQTDHISGFNSSHVVLLNGGESNAGSSNPSSNITNATTLSGLSITGGQANETGSRGRGSGLYCDGQNSGNECSPTLSNMVIKGNLAIDGGGGVYSDARAGGASSPRIIGVVFVGNSATFASNGGAFFSDVDTAGIGESVLSSTVFLNNYAGDQGGAMYLEQSAPDLINVTVTDNEAGTGSGIYVQGDALFISNSILRGNQNIDDIETGTNVSVTVEYSIVEEGRAGTEVRSIYPGFDDPFFPIGPDGRYGTVDDGINLAPGSPAFDAGTNGSLPSQGGDTDVAGKDRTQDLDGDGTSTVNLGAYESIVPRAPTVSIGPVMSATEATFSGAITPGGTASTVRFRLTPASPLGQDTLIAVEDVFTGAIQQTATVTARRLEPSTTYRVELEARNEEGTATTDSVTFETPPAPNLRLDEGAQSMSLAYTFPERSDGTIEDTTFLARRGGTDQYEPLPLRTVEGFIEGTRGELRLSTTIPDSLITPQGVDYIFSARSVIGGKIASLSLPVLGASPLHLPVFFESLSAKTSFPKQTYRMVSVPAQQADVQSSLIGTYGSYRPTRWRALQWNAETRRYEEFPDLGADAFQPGKAFWLITAEGTGFSIEEGKTVDASTPKSIELEPGWTQVGNPFGFPVSWEAVKAASGLTGADLDGPFIYRDEEFEVTSTLRPWTGSFVFNATSETQSLAVPPTSGEASTTAASAALGKAKAVTAKKEAPRASAPYTLKVTAQTEDHAQSVWMGLRGEATTGRDGLDVAQPPPVKGNVQLSVMETIGKQTVPHAGSFKPSGGEGQTWRLVLSSATDEPTTVRLDLTSTGQLPEGHERYVVDLEREARVAPGEALQLGEGERRTLKVIVGEENYADRKSEGITKRGYEDNLQSNYPNPFEEATTLRYSLSEKRSVTLEVYNVLGQRVRTLVNEKKEAGLHQVQWEGENRYGKQVSSGVYFVQLRAGAVQKTQKVVLVR